MSYIFTNSITYHIKQFSASFEIVFQPNRISKYHTTTNTRPHASILNRPHSFLNWFFPPCEYSPHSEFIISSNLFWFQITKYEISSTLLEFSNGIINFKYYCNFSLACFHCFITALKASVFPFKEFT